MFGHCEWRMFIRMERQRSYITYSSKYSCSLISRSALKRELGRYQTYHQLPSKSVALLHGGQQPPEPHINLYILDQPCSAARLSSTISEIHHETESEVIGLGP